MRDGVALVAKCLFGTAALAVGISTVAQAQTAQPQAAPTVKKQPAPPAASPATWKVNCSNSPGGLDCRALQTLFMKKTGQPVLTVAVRVPPDTKRPQMLFSLPLGSYLPAGVAIQFGNGEAKALAIQNCDRSGCLARYAVTEAELGAMQKGSDLTITLQDMQKKPITFTVPVSGFAQAYAKIK